ncbi:MAG: bifunctional nicotinamidase/pyrazinamidase [Chitinophagales bacterium]|nr:bifunctional nicotinamidase/pyrazinamidase [Chitinophagales bacterium]
MKALLLVDIQNDFCPGGALEVKEGDQVVPIANQLMEHFDLVVATKDWHPANHGSFAANHLWRYPGQTIELDGLEQILWPIHCVQDSFGALLVKTLNTEKIEKIFQKGTDPNIDSYSGFFDNAHRKATGLGNFLKDKGVEEIYVMGLAQDYCVKYTILDALELGFKTYLIADGTRAVNLNPEDGDNAIKEMKAKGAIVINSNSLTK